MGIEVFEMWCFRMMGKFKWSDLISNEKVLKILKTKRSLLSSIQQRKLKYYGHIKRKDNIFTIDLLIKPRFDWGCVAFRPMSKGFPRVMFPYGETATTLQSTSLCRQCLFTFLPTCFKRINSLRLDVVQNHVYRSISERRSIIDGVFYSKGRFEKSKSRMIKRP